MKISLLTIVFSLVSLFVFAQDMAVVENPLSESITITTSDDAKSVEAIDAKIQEQQIVTQLIDFLSEVEYPSVAREEVIEGELLISFVVGENNTLQAFIAKGNSDVFGATVLKAFQASEIKAIVPDNYAGRKSFLIPVSFSLF